MANSSGSSGQVKSNATLGIGKPKTSVQRLESIVEDLVHAQNSAQSLLAKVKDLKYSPGDLMFHKEHGNCIIMEKYVDISQFDLVRKTDEYYLTTPEEKPDVGYIVVGPKVHGVVSEKDIEPVNAANQVLYKEKQ